MAHPLRVLARGLAADAAALARERNDVVPAPDQLAHDVLADVAGRADDQDAHVGRPPLPVVRCRRRAGRLAAARPLRRPLRPHLLREQLAG